MSVKGSRAAFAVLAGLGCAILLAAAAIELVGSVTNKDYEIPHTVFYIGAVFGFAGFFGLDPKRAKEGVGVIFSALPKFGRRSTDAVAIPEAETTVKAVPVQTTADPTNLVRVERPTAAKARDLARHDATPAQDERGNE